MSNGSGEFEPIDAVPWLGMGRQALEAFGSLFRPDISSYMGGIIPKLTRFADASRFVWCLATLGYTAREMHDILEEQSGRRIPWPNRTLEDAERIARERVAAGIPQGELIRECLEGQRQYGNTLPEDIIRGGREIPGAPPPTDTTPPVVGPAEPLPPDAAPDDAGQVDPTQPPQQQGRQLDVPSLLSAMMAVWQNLLRWRQIQSQQGWNLNVQLPSIQVPGTVQRPAVPYPTPGGDDMFVNTSVLDNGGGGWTGLLSQGLNLASQIMGGGNQSMPGGAPLGFSQLSFDLPGIDIVGQGQGTTCANLQSPFAAGGGRGARAKTHVRADPVTGRAVWFRPAGRPILWTSDLSAAKRVRKVAARARRARGGR